MYNYIPMHFESEKHSICKLEWKIKISKKKWGLTTTNILGQIKRVNCLLFPIIDMMAAVSVASLRQIVSMLIEEQKKSNLSKELERSYVKSCKNLCVSMH